MNRPTIFLFTMLAWWDQQAGRRYDFHVRGFFSLEGALHYARTRMSEPARQASWIADRPPRGWIARGEIHGKVIRRHSVSKRKAART
jgi:hypothetical protein